MKSQNGGRSKKRKPETNYVDPYKGPSTLPPPPAMRDVIAVPAKLRKIMQMKSSAAEGHGKSIRQAEADVQHGKRSGKNLAKVQKKDPVGKGLASFAIRDPRTANPDVDSKLDGEDSVAIAQKRTSKRREKGEAELSMLLEKMDRRNKGGTRKGVAPRRKSYLEAKKNKGQHKAMESDSKLVFHQHDKVEFGETVQAPPRLSFPAKAAQVKKKEKMQRSGSIFNEKSRLQAIEAYRQRKGWSSRPGGAQLPLLNLTDASR